MTKLQMDLRRDFDLEIIERATHRVFAYLCTVERDLSYIGVNADIFERHRRRVESFLSKIAPQVLDQFTAAYRRAREDDAESKTHALTTCRRILESVADVVYPPRAEPVVDSSGKTRKVGTENYVNRLWMFASESMSGSTQSKLLLATLGDFGARIDTVYSHGQQGGARQSDPGGGRHVRHADLPAGERDPADLRGPRQGRTGRVDAAGTAPDLGAPGGFATHRGAAPPGPDAPRNRKPCGRTSKATLAAQVIAWRRIPVLISAR